MSTGVESWNVNLLEIGAMYPFPGTEYVLAIAGIASWIIWHLIQMGSETAQLKREAEIFKDKAKLAKAMELSNAETLIESLKAHNNSQF